MTYDQALEVSMFDWRMLTISVYLEKLLVFSFECSGYLTARAAQTYNSDIVPIADKILLQHVSQKKQQSSKSQRLLFHNYFAM